VLLEVEEGLQAGRLLDSCRRKFRSSVSSVIISSLNDCTTVVTGLLTSLYIVHILAANVLYICLPKIMKIEIMKVIAMTIS